MAIIMRGSPCGRHSAVMSPPSPPCPLSASIASNLARYSGVNGACWPRPCGLVGSQPGPIPGPRTHCPDQSGNRGCSCAAALTTANRIAAAAATPILFEFMGADLDVHSTDGLAFQRDNVTWVHRADAGWRSGVINVAGIERIERRGKLDEPPNAEHQMLGVAVLAYLPVHGKRKGYVVGIGHFIGRDHEGTEHRIAIG